MASLKREPYLLIAEDDEDDRQLIQAAFLAKGFKEKLVFTEDGEELLAFMHKNITEPPVFILLDLNMPKKGGQEALQEIKQHPGMRKTPVIIFSTTQNQQIINHCYELGANSYILKPSIFESLLQSVELLRKYWIEAVVTPS
jgi:CheY-like chemotaxis protein